MARALPTPQPGDVWGEHLNQSITELHAEALEHTDAKVADLVKVYDSFADAPALPAGTLVVSLTGL